MSSMAQDLPDSPAIADSHTDMLKDVIDIQTVAQDFVSLNDLRRKP